MLLYAGLFFLIIIGSGLLRYAAPMRHAEPETPCGSAAWRAEIRTAQNYHADHFSSMWGGEHSVSEVRGEVAVRITRGGKDFLTVGTVKTDDDDFDDALQTMVAKAQDRAATLNAMNELIAA